jgi:anti-sigma B factor antagonist
VPTASYDVYWENGPLWHSCPVGLFSLDVTRDGTTVTLTPRGELDLFTVRQFRELATRSLREPDTATLVADFSALGFLDSTGLGCLVVMQRLADAKNKMFELRGVPVGVTRLLSITGLSGFFTTSP